ncbi:hypothetical protein [Rhizobium sp. CF142]|uniref:hypothetical protein n=1 Tax=Rhizobium sp. CF142 TaxID=1144314 RepID=UPI00026EF4B8|nr:hypothetical protein [Rhizobium sp. CF142]EJJ27637.1 hypothetical protein PMI11_04038 [Rhizobium sp. CF142]
MKFDIHVALSFIAYFFFALILFDDILAPLGFMTVRYDGLNLPYWKTIVAGCFFIAAMCFLAASWPPFKLPYKILISAIVGVSLSVFSVGKYADRVRHQKIVEFNADVAFENSFFRSLKEAPVEFQFYLHAAALKNCTPYAWSYRLMAFYELEPDVAVNVLPDEWVKRCSIHRSS